MIDQEIPQYTRENFYAKQLTRMVRNQKNDLIDQTEELYLNKKFREAEEFLLTMYPKVALSIDQEALTFMGHIQIQLRQLDLAIEYFKRALSQRGKIPVFIKDSLGIAYFNKSMYEKACLYFCEASNQEINHVIYHLHFAFACEKMVSQIKNQLKTELNGENISKLEEEMKVHKEQIKEEYSHILRINPDHYDTLLNFGIFEAREGRLEESEKLLLHALSIRSKDYILLLNIGNLQYRRQKYKKAIEFFEKAIAIFGEQKSLKLLIPYMVALNKMEIWEKLEHVAKQVLRINKKNMRALAYLSRALKENQKYGELTNLYKKIKNSVKSISERSGGEKKDKHETIGKIKKKLREKMNEVNHLRKFKEGVYDTNQSNNMDNEDTSPKVANINLDSTMAHGFKGKDAEELIEKIKSESNEIDTNFNNAMMKFKEENYEKSEELFEKVLAANPNYNTQIIFEKLGDINLKEHKNVDKALEFFMKALKMNANEILFIKIGRCYELQSDYETALKEYKKAYEINPNLVWTFFHMGCVMSKMKNPDALKYLEMAYEREKENIDILQHYANELVQSSRDEDINKGIEILEKAKDFYVGNVDLLCSLAIGYDKKGRLDEAIALLETANNYPAFFSDQYKLYQLAFYYEKKKNFGKAVEFFKSVLVINKGSIRSLLHLGVIFKTAKEYKKAFKCFRAVLELEPNNSIANYGIARVYQIMGENDNDTIEHFLKCIKVDPTNIKAYIQIGIIYLKNKNVQKSLTYLSKAYEIDQKNILCLVGLGNVYQEMKDLEKAENYLKQAYHLDHNNVNALCCYGDVLFCLGKYDEAIKKYEKALKSTDIAEVHFNIAHCYYLVEQFDYAVSHYISALKIKKNTRHDYYYYLACALLASGRTKDAIKCFRCAIKLNDRKSFYYFNLGNAYFVYKKFAKAILCVERAIQVETVYPTKGKQSLNMKDANFLLFKSYFAMPSINYEKCEALIKGLIREEPNNVEYLDYLASLQEKTNRTQEAIQTYKSIEKIDPNNENAKNSLSRLEDN